MLATNVLFSCPIALKLRTEHDSLTIVLRVKLQNDLMLEMSGTTHEIMQYVSLSLVHSRWGISCNKTQQQGKCLSGDSDLMPDVITRQFTSPQCGGSMCSKFVAGQ